MNNPEYHHTIDIPTIYRYDTHKNIPWSIPAYRTPKLEVNADLQIKKRKWKEQKKGVKDGRYVTKRGFYMDYQLKVAKSIPSTHVYGAQKSWDFEKIRKSGSNQKIDRKLSKNTYLDFIEMTQKSHKSPGIGSYNIQKPLKEKQQLARKSRKALNIGERIFFYQNNHALSNLVPGAGNYSPHSISSQSSIDNKDYKYWVKKHKEENEKLIKRQSLKPAPGTHSPLNTTLKTFEQLSIELLKPTKRNYFGKDAKFEYTRQSRKKIIQKRPDPSVHSTIVEWKGKNTDSKKTLHAAIWRGYSQSVYH